MNLKKRIVLLIILILIPTMSLSAHGDEEDGDEDPVTEVHSENETNSEEQNDDTEIHDENEAVSEDHNENEASSDNHGDDTENHSDNEATIGGFELSSPAILAISIGVALLVTGGTWFFVPYHSYTLLDHGLFALIIITAVIHLIFGIQGDLLLLLNGLGYFGLAGLRLLPIAQKKPYNNYISGAIIVYTLITIIGYLATHLDHLDTIGLVTKAVEILLIVVLLVIVYRTNRTRTLVQN